MSVVEAGLRGSAVGMLMLLALFHLRDARRSPSGRNRGLFLLSGPTSIAWGGQDMCDVYIGSILTPYVLKGKSSVPGLPMVHQRQWR